MSTVAILGLGIVLGAAVASVLWMLWIYRAMR